MGAECLGFVSAFLELLAIILLRYRNRYGFLLNMIGNLGWVVYSLITGTAYGLILVCLCALYVNQQGFVGWGKRCVCGKTKQKGKEDAKT